MSTGCRRKSSCKRRILSITNLGDIIRTDSPGHQRTHKQQSRKQHHTMPPQLRCIIFGAECPVLT
ncbi:MAG: hypothetical protein O0W99_02830 [Methanocorpusculum sp.]|nr:hypothetical protein [Methanocorpusculum sp.]MDE2545723.1 hypothetical protein [Methanocorpusculum sp.]